MKGARLTIGAPNKVPRALDLGGLVLEWWIYWGRGLFVATTIAWFIQARTKVSDIYRMLPGADLNREQLVKINPRRLVYFIL